MAVDAEGTKAAPPPGRSSHTAFLHMRKTAPVQKDEPIVGDLVRDETVPVQEDEPVLQDPETGEVVPVQEYRPVPTYPDTRNAVPIPKLVRVEGNPESEDPSMCIVYIILGSAGY